MAAIKAFLLKYLEELLILSIILIFVIIHYFLVQKIALLNFYYIPVLLAGYYLGRKEAFIIAWLSVGVVCYFVILYPENFLKEANTPYMLFWNIATWGLFLVTASYVVGILYEEKEKKIDELKKAYVGILEILAKYLESTDSYTHDHSIRVAENAVQIAELMKLPLDERETIKAAALLHDIGKIDVSIDVLRKTASLSSDEKSMIDLHTEKGAEILQQTGIVLKDAIPIILAHHEYYVMVNNKDLENRKNIPLGARIISVADAYDAMITDRPYRAGMTPWNALKELEKGAGTQFDPKVVEAFKEIKSRELGHE